jgi:glutamine synthetase adenylyltransferase
VPGDLAPEAAIPMVPLAAAGDTDHITLGSNDPPLGPISNDGSTVEDVVTEGLVSDTLSASSPGLEHAIEALVQTVSRLDSTMSTQARRPTWFSFVQTIMAVSSLLLAIIMARPQWFDHLLNVWMARLALKSYCENYTQTVRPGTGLQRLADFSRSTKHNPLHCAPRPISRTLHLYLHSPSDGACCLPHRST